MAARVGASRTAQQNGPPKAAPNQTLYCTNVNDKLQKADLRRALYTLFSTYGPVLDVVALKTMKMRGQAHIVFRDVHASTQAMRALQGFDFFGKELGADVARVQRIAYAKSKSDGIAKLDGTYKTPAAAAAPASTELQQSIFSAPPSSKAVAPVAAPAASAPEVPNGGTVREDDAKSPQGVKRRREEESDEEGAPMEEDEDDVMEESDDE
ncbi:RNA binding domain protein [Cryomyces antarcticus]